MPRVNHEILKWARMTAHLTEEVAAKKLGIKDTKGASALEKLAALESGETAPTRPMLVKMAKQYRRPLLTFYLSDVPRLGNRGEDYRTLPDTVEMTQEGFVDVVIRDIRARQSLVRGVLEEEDEAVRLPFINSHSLTDGVETVTSALQQIIHWDLAEYREQPDMDRAFSLLREKTEEAGVFVLLIDNLGSHHTTIEVESFRGFALADDVAPFIAINANDSKGAWCFTLVHELAHLLLGATGISAGYGDQQIEKFCNDVASEFLVPIEEIRKLAINNRTDFDSAKDTIEQFARNFKVSGTMVAYKLCRAEKITYKKFLEFQTAFKADYLRYKAAQRLKARETEGGPSYYITKKHRVGNGLITLIGRMLYGGAITTTKAGKVLGVRAQNVPGVLESSGPYAARNIV